MKKLHELGISPTPWSFADDGIGEYDIRCSGVPYGEDYEGDDIIAQSVQKKDAPMLAAAPELYECLRELFEFIEQYEDEEGFLLISNHDKFRKALAKATGEEE